MGFAWSLVVWLLLLQQGECQNTSSPSVTPPTLAPSTSAPSTLAPSAAPTDPPTSLPTTSQPTTSFPTTSQPTAQPTSSAPTSQPTTSFPTTLQPTAQPTTTSPVTSSPTRQPTTLTPTSFPTTSGPTTHSPTQSPTPPTSNPTRSPTSTPTQPTNVPTRSPTTAIPTATPTYAPTQCPIYCTERQTGPLYCPNLHLGCENGGYFSKTTACDMTDTVRVLYVSNAAKFGNDFDFPVADMCICQPGYRGFSCAIPLPETCKARNQLFDGSFGILDSSPTKNFYCRLKRTGLATMIPFIHHRMQLVVQPGGTRISFSVHTRRSLEQQASVPGVAENCSYLHDWINADLTNCTVQYTNVDNLAAKTVKMTCHNNDVRSCQSYDDGRNPRQCDWFYNDTLSRITPTGVATAEFLKVNDTTGVGSGTISLPFGAFALPLDFECDTGLCVDDLDFTNVTVYPEIEPLTDNTGAIIGGTLGGFAAVFGALALGCFVWRKQQKVQLLEEPATSDVANTTVVMEERQLADGIGLAWQDVNYFIQSSNGKSTLTRFMNKTQKQILNGQYGLVLPGQVCAILGPSGAGKTSLLNILADRRDNYEGDVQLVGRAVAGLSRRDVISYVQQYDSLMSTQTVRESLRFSAMLRIPNASQIRPQIEARITDLLARLKISHIADSVIGSHEHGGISGGERKRVDIGIELITNPALLLLDEPTSGLDSNNVDVLLGVLRTVADFDKCAILLTIHQVSGRFFMAFDQVLLMSNRGRTAYFGSPANAVAHCKLTASPDSFGPLDNPAEVLLQEAVQASGKQGSEGKNSNVAADAMATTWIESAARGELLKQIQTQMEDEQRNSQRRSIVTLKDRPVRACPVQFFYLFQRALRNFSRDMSLFILTISFSTIISIFVGFVFYKIDDRIPGLQNRFGLMFFLCIYFCLTSLSSLGKFVGNRTVFQREMVSGYYRVLPYYFSECLSDLIALRIIPPIIFAMILTELVGLQRTPEKIETFILILILTNIVSTAMCLMVSAGSSSIGQANYIAVLITIVSLIFGGLILSNDSTSDLSQIKAVSFIHYSYEALMSNELHGKEYYFNPKGYGLDLRLPGDIYLANYGMSYDNMNSNLWGLFVFFLVFLFVGYLFLLDIVGSIRRLTARAVASNKRGNSAGVALTQMKKMEEEAKPQFSRDKTLV